MGGDVHATYESTNATMGTMGGGIVIDTTQTTGTINASTMGGDIDVTLPSATLFTVDAGTMGGRVRHGSIPMAATTERESQLVGRTEAGPGLFRVRAKPPAPSRR